MSWTQAVLRDGLDLAVINACVIFLGPSRSGTSVAGAFLDAHPQCCVGHEVGGLVGAGLHKGRVGLLPLVVSSQKIARGRGRYSGKAQGGLYSQALDGQRKPDLSGVRFLGNKNAPNDLLDLGCEPLARLVALEERLEMPVRCVAMVRNPWDVYATNVVAGERNSPAAIHHIAERWGRALTELADRVLVVRLDEMNRRPREVVRSLFSHARLPPSPGLLDRCVAHLRSPVPRGASHPWTPDEVALLRDLVRRFPFLRGYPEPV